MFTSLGIVISSTLAAGIAAGVFMIVIGMLFGMFNRQLELGVLIGYSMVVLSAICGGGIGFIVALTQASAGVVDAGGWDILSRAALFGLLGPLPAFFILRIMH